MDWSKYYPANYSAITEADIEMIREKRKLETPVEDKSDDKPDDDEEIKAKSKEEDEDEVDEAKTEGCPCCDGGPCECPEGCEDCDCSAKVDEMSKDEYKDSNMKKDQEKKKKKDDPEEVEFSKDQDTVTKMEAVDHGKPGAVDIYKETIALAKVTRGRDKLALEGAAKLIKQRSYDKLAPYLDSMEEEPRQSVLMILMNDQKIADKVMKKMKTENYHGWLMSEMHQKYDGLTWAEIGERLIRTPERRLVSLAYATKMGTIDAPSPEVQKLADECELADLEKAAGSIIGEDDDLDENLNELENPMKTFQQDRTQKKADKAQARMDRDDKHADNLAVIQKEKDRKAAAKAAKGPSLVQKAAGAIKTAVTGGGKGKSDAEKIADKNKSDNAKKAASTNSNNQSDQKKADTSRAADSAAADKAQAKRQADAEKDRALRKKQKDAEKARATDDAGIKKDAGPSTTRSKLANLAFSALEKFGESYEEEVPETIDARRRVFKEKIRKLAYEKAKEIIAKQQAGPDPALESKKEEEEDSEENGSKIKETGKVDNKIKVEPTVKESTGVSFVRKYKQKMAAEQKDATLENSILEYLAGSSFGGVGQANPVGGEFASDDSPASATSIARALKCSPMQVQRLLDDMLEAGQITRVGDAYSYASPRPAEPQGEKEDSGLEV